MVTLGLQNDSVERLCCLRFLTLQGLAESLLEAKPLCCKIEEHRPSSELQGANNLEMGSLLTNKNWILLIPLPVFTAHCLSHRNS